MTGFGGSGEKRTFGGREDCPHGPWDPAAAPAGVPASSGGGFGPKNTWWKCEKCGMVIQSVSRPQPEDFETSDEDYDDD